LVEHIIRNDGVAGSSPASGTSFLAKNHEPLDDLPPAATSQPQRAEIGTTDGDVVQRIASQVWSTPDRLVLVLEVRSDRARALERVAGKLSIGNE
jgi:hypothetical protein